MKLDPVPVQHLGSVPTGYSKPQLVQLNDGLTYVMKFVNNPTGMKVLVNEYVAAQIAELLSLPVPPSRVVPVSDSFIKQSPELSALHFMPGNAFASLYIENCFYPSQSFLQTSINEIVNRDMLAGIIVFDVWLSNTDRKQKNMLVKPLDNGLYYVYMIDHGRCFANSNWTLKSLEKMNKKPKSELHKWFMSSLNISKHLDDYLHEALSIPDDKLYYAVYAIPDDWDITEAEKEALLTHLLKARERLPDLMAK